MATVLDTVTKMIANWPTLYPNRASALKHCFTSPRWKWVDGDLVPENECELERGTVSVHTEVDGDLDQRLRISRANAIIDWTVDNAEHLAQDRMSVPEHKCLWLPDSYDRFADMPEDANADWRQAGIDMLRQLWQDTRDAEPGTHEYSAHRKLTNHMIFYRLLNPAEQEDKLIQAWSEVQELESRLRTSIEALWYPRIEAALAEDDEEAAMALVTRIPDTVTQAFALDKIRQWRLGEG